MQNSEICQIFRNIANILEIKGENVFRVRAYERAAQNIEGLSDNLEEYIKKDKLRQVPGIGEDLAYKIKEYASTGKIKFYERLKRGLPAGLLELLEIPSVGPKTVRLLYEKLKIKNISGLESAVKKNKLKGIFGIKEKTVQNIQKGIDILKRGKQRLLLPQAAMIADEITGALKKIPEARRTCVAGSLRRNKDTVRDIDILVVSDNPRKIMRAFVSLEPVRDILAQGQTKSAVRTKMGAQVDCRVVEDKSYGAALIYFTGSKDFNIKLRQIAIKKGLKINEYGVFRKNKFIAGYSEEEVFKSLGMAYIEPELRENSGEIESAQKHGLPHLIEPKDIRGDLHVHSDWSDGSSSIEELAAAAGAMRYSYIAVTDHSQGLKIAGGLTPKELKKKKEQIEKINKKIKNFRVLFGTEAEIDSFGQIDYKDKILKEFDIVIAAIHSGFKQSREQLTRRIIRACENKYVHIIAHPTGRLWGSRDAYDIDLEKIFKAAKETNTRLEINAFTDRMDLNSRNCRQAKEIGAKFAIGTDAHIAGQMNLMKYGVSLARRGWLSKSDVLNTLTADKLLKAIKK